MEESEEIVILRAYRPFLSILTAFDLNNFRGVVNRRELKYSILIAIVISVFLFVFVIMFLPMELAACIKQKFNLNVICQEISFFLGGTQGLVIYGSFMWEHKKFTEIFDYLFGIVKQRM